MNLRVERQTFTSFSTAGELFIDGEHFCYTLEPKQEPPKPYCIPEGTYSLVKRFSPKHGRDVPHVENVPGFEEIEIHWGNFPQNTDGCLLVGRTKGTDFVGASKLAFSDLWEKLVPIWAEGEEINITYTTRAAMTPEEIAACEELINTPITPENVNQPLVPFFPKKEEKK